MTDEPIFKPTAFYRDPLAALRWLEKAFGFETTTLVTDGRTSVSKTPLADFCPPSRQAIVFCSRKPSFSVP